jgi:hypothetical protein
MEFNSPTSENWLNKNTAIFLGIILLTIALLSSPWESPTDYSNYNSVQFGAGNGNNIASINPTYSKQKSAYEALPNNEIGSIGSENGPQIDVSDPYVQLAEETSLKPKYNIGTQNEKFKSSSKAQRYYSMGEQNVIVLNNTNSERSNSSTQMKSDIKSYGAELNHNNNYTNNSQNTVLAQTSDRHGFSALSSDLNPIESLNTEIEKPIQKFGGDPGDNGGTVIPVPDGIWLLLSFAIFYAVWISLNKFRT